MFFSPSGPLGRCVRPFWAAGGRQIRSLRRRSLATCGYGHRFSAGDPCLIWPAFARNALSGPNCPIGRLGSWDGSLAGFACRVFGAVGGDERLWTRVVGRNEFRKGFAAREAAIERTCAAVIRVALCRHSHGFVGCHPNDISEVESGFGGVDHHDRRHQIRPMHRRLFHGTDALGGRKLIPTAQSWQDMGRRSLGGIGNRHRSTAFACLLWLFPQIAGAAADPAKTPSIPRLLATTALLGAVMSGTVSWQCPESLVDLAESLWSKARCRARQGQWKFAASLVWGVCGT